MKLRKSTGALFSAILTVGIIAGITGFVPFAYADEESTVGIESATSETGAEATMPRNLEQTNSTIKSSTVQATATEGTGEDTPAPLTSIADISQADSSEDQNTARIVEDPQTDSQDVLPSTASSENPETAAPLDQKDIQDSKRLVSNESTPEDTLDTLDTLNTPDQTPSTQVLTTGTPSTLANSETIATPLEAGIYTIQSSVAGTYVLDVAGGSMKNSGNVHIYNSNKTDAQRWRISYDTDGYYSISSVKSGLMLDLSGGYTRNTQNVWQYESNNTPAQKWIIAKDGNGFTITAAKDRRFALDVAGAQSKNGANVWLYQANGTPAQRWWFIPEKPALTPENTVEDGIYELRLAKSNSYGVDLAGQAVDNGANIHLYSANNTIAQRWAITREQDGYYTVKSVSSGKTVEVAGGAVAARSNVAQYADNGSEAQRWAIDKNSDGSYTFLNKKTGLALDITNGTAANGTNVRVFLALRGDSQRFTLKKAEVLPEDIYTIYTMLAPSRQTIDTPGGSKSNNTNDWLYSANGTMAQKFMFRRVAENTFAIQNVYSGMYLEDNNGTVVQRKRATAASAQSWKASFEKAGVVLQNTQTNKRMATAGGKSANGTAITTASQQNSTAQRWRMRGVALLTEGRYTLTNLAGNKVLEVASDSLANNANIQVGTNAKTAGQVFTIQALSGGYYSIINEASEKAVEVAGGSKANSANVQQNTWNNTARQLWKPELREDGALVFVNKASGKVLDVAGGSSASGANVQSYENNNTPAQGWSIKATQSASISGNAELDRYIRQIAAANNKNLRSCFDWTVNNIRWTNSVAGEVLGNGIIDKQKTINMALYAFRNNRGDCYYYASAFKWLAIACGYSSQARAGSVPSASQGLAAHGWTEVYLNGTTYVCDANLAIDIPGYNWYMVTYDTAPVQYYL